MPEQTYITLTATRNGMGVSLSVDAASWAHLAEAFIQLGLQRPEWVVSEIIAEFGQRLELANYEPATSPILKVSWPRLLYLLHVLQKLAPPLPETSLVKKVLPVLCDRAREELDRLQRKCYMPISYFVDSSTPLYEGDAIEGLLLMTEMALIKHKPVSDRMNFLSTCMETLTPGAWIHYDTLEFVQSIDPYSRQMDFLRLDVEDDLNQMKW